MLEKHKSFTHFHCPKREYMIMILGFKLFEYVDIHTTIKNKINPVKQPIKSNHYDTINSMFLFKTGLL